MITVSDEPVDFSAVVSAGFGNARLTRPSLLQPESLILATKASAGSSGREASALSALSSGTSGGR